jgi:hypothetical protein
MLGDHNKFIFLVIVVIWDCNIMGTESKPGFCLLLNNFLPLFRVC